MSINMGTADRIVRAVLGVILLYLAFMSGLPLFEGAVFKYGAALVGIIMLATSAIKMCPFYALFGIKTCKEC